MAEIIEYAIQDRKRVLLGKVIFSFILITLIYAWFSHTLLHQLRSPVLKYPYVDPAYWIMHLLKIPDGIVGNNILASIVDILLFASCIACIKNPFSKIFLIVFLFAFFIYIISFNSYGGHHVHSLVVILFVPIPFLFRNKITFTFLWEGLRYYTVFILVSAFFWKLFRLSFLNDNHGLLILKNNLTPYLFYNPDTLLSKFYWWLLQYPSCINAMYIVGFFLEGVFIVGFFTKKFDNYLLILSWVMVIGFLILADALFLQLFILSLTFINFNKIKSDSYL